MCLAAHPYYVWLILNNYPHNISVSDDEYNLKSRGVSDFSRAFFCKFKTELLLTSKWNSNSVQSI